MNGHTFKLIDLLPSAVMEWIGGRDGGTDDGADRLVGAVTGGIARAAAAVSQGGCAAEAGDRTVGLHSHRGDGGSCSPLKRIRGPLLEYGPRTKGDAHEKDRKADGHDHRRAGDSGQLPSKVVPPSAATFGQAG